MDVGHESSELGDSRPQAKALTRWHGRAARGPCKGGPRYLEVSHVAPEQKHWDGHQGMLGQTAMGPHCDNSCVGHEGSGQGQGHGGGFRLCLRRLMPSKEGVLWVELRSSG